MQKSKRIVIKIGTSSLTYENGKLNIGRIEKLTTVLSDIRNSGKEVILVSSGSIAVGTSAFEKTKRPDDIPGKQAAAAIGQAELIKIYQNFFNQYNIKVAQILLTKDCITCEKRKNNANNTLEKLISIGAIPIINENDTIATEEIEFGDNDSLAVDVSKMIKADLLILLTDVNGLYSSNPNINRNATLIHKVSEINKSLLDMAESKETKWGKGGMLSKIIAGKRCIESGIDMIITNGNSPDDIIKILNGENIGTLFSTKEKLIQTI